MRNFHLAFAYPWAPWLFLLLIPAAALTLIPYFLLNKKYRKTRNRITSMVLHLMIMLLAICVLTGVTFVYEVGNPDNELLLLVDVSETEETVAERRDNVVDDIIRDSAYDGFKVGIVTFGFSQVYAVPFTYDIDSIYDQYEGAELPDTSATDIAAALRYARTLFSNPETSKIVLITDGKETDEQAISVIGSIATQGTRVDAVYLSSAFEEDRVQVTDVQFPDYHLETGDVCEIGVTLQSKENTDATLVEFYDNGTLNDELTQTVPLYPGSQTVVFNTVFETDGLHEIRIKVTESQDGMQSNNEYYAYYYLQRFNHVLIIEHESGQSEELVSLLEDEEADYVTTVLNLTEAEEYPTTVEELRQYDQIILNNIANADLRALPVPSDRDPGDADWFVKNLYSYVYDYGGGLFTVGGSDASGEAHSYNRVDMYNSLYQQMLPVQAIEYTPPVGVMVVIDISGSMTEEGGSGLSKLYWAKQGAIACLDALTERDYIGVMTLDSVYGDVLPLTPRTRESYIRETILAIDGTGGTVYSDAIRRAGQKLTSLKGVDRRHIIVVSDGAPSASDEELYLQETKNNYENEGITLSFVGIGVTEGSQQAEKMVELVETGHGKIHYVDNSNLPKLLDEMRDDLNAPDVKEVNDEPFNPQIADVRSPLLSGVEYGEVKDEEGTVLNRALDVKLYGFYGVKARTNVDLVLMGNYEVPIYAQWKFGRGMVGSFMSDLNGRWSSDFLRDENARKFLYNAVSNLMPIENIRPNEITVDLSGENYINQVNVYTSLEEGQTLRAQLTDTESGTSYSLNEVTVYEGAEPDIYVTLALDANNRYSRCSFVLKRQGTYCITIEKCDADGNVLATCEVYKSFSYSLEYDQNLESTDTAETLRTLSGRANGVMIEDEDGLWQIFENFVTSITRTFDPRWLFMGLAMVLFLLDIAARKFKFKWPHELIRDYKEKRAEKNGTEGRRS